MSTETTYAYYSSGTFGAIASAFVIESLEHLLPWLMVMAAIILCDLFSGLARCVKLGVKVRFSKAVRDTFAKSIVYFAFCVSVAMVDVASGGEYGIDKWACLIICFIEGASMISNIMRWHGYDLNFNKLIGVILKKHADIDLEDSDGIIKKARPERVGKDKSAKR